MDSGFQNGLSGVDVFEITSVGIQEDRKVLVGGLGGFTMGYAPYVARLLVDGMLDVSFQPRLSTPNSWVYCVLVQNDGKVLAGGDFGLARLKSNGIPEDFFHVDGAVHSIVVQSDGKIVIGGGFESID